MNTGTYRRATALLFGFGILSFAWWIGAGAPPAFARNPTVRKDGPTQTIKAAGIVRDPSDLTPPVDNRPPAVAHVALTSKELVGVLDPASGTNYRYWTFDGKVPGPFIRVRQGDTVEVALKNAKDSKMVHSVDLHAVIGPGGGAVLLQVPPGQWKTFSFETATPGLFIYDCGSPMIAQHVVDGMYGLILVEPSGGLPHIEHEYYAMLSDFYTTAPKGKSGLERFSVESLMAENAQYYIFNGAVDSIVKEYPLHANEGQIVRICFGNAGPNATASIHTVGEVVTRYYQFGSLSSPPLEGIQTATIPPSDAGIFEVNARVPGQFTLMDHAISRMEKSDLAFLEVKDPEKIALMHAGPVTPNASGVMASHVTPGAQQSYYRSFREHNAAMADVQPSWMGPLIQSDARLGQAIRFSVSDAAFPGEQTLNYGNNHGISLIAGRRFQFDLDPPSFFRNHSSAHKDGFGNAGTQLKWRIASGNAEHGNYAVSSIIYYAFAPRVYQNQMLTSFYAPAVAAGRGFGRFAVMSKFGGILPTGKIAQQGRGIEWDVTAQVHSSVRTWLDVEDNALFNFDGPFDGKTQNFLTPAAFYMIRRREWNPEHATVVMGGGMQIATSSFHFYNHNLISELRVVF